MNGVKDEKTDRAIGLCRKAVSAFSYSWKKRRDMAELQVELGLPPHQLVTESPTRWGSRQKMIERFLEQEKVISRILAGDRKTRHLVPAWQDLEVLESIDKAIKPLQEFTDALSGESYVSVSCVKPVLHLFRTSLLQPQEGDLRLTTTIKGKILNYLEEKYREPENDELLDMASLLDPRFRTTYITPSKLDEIKMRAINEIAELGSEEEHPAVPQCEKSPPKKKTLAAFFKKAAPAAGSQQSVRQKIEGELTSYLLGPEVDPDIDPLDWWKRHEPDYTRLSRLARKYLVIPATSAPSERVFSVGGGIVTCNRACLKPAVVDKLIFLAKNV